VRDADVAAASLGFDPVRVKTAAFAISAALTGLAGAVLPPLMLFIAPRMPAGTSQSTTRVVRPKNSSRYSASPASASGRSTVTRAPNRGPSTVPAPPTTTARTNRIDCVKGARCCRR
jgi:hypothetical protein